MIVSSLRRCVARILDRLADAIDPDVPIEMVEEEKIQVFPAIPTMASFCRPMPIPANPHLVADWDAVEAECAELVQSFERDDCDHGCSNCSTFMN